MDLIAWKNNIIKGSPSRNYNYPKTLSNNCEYKNDNNINITNIKNNIKKVNNNKIINQNNYNDINNAADNLTRNMPYNRIIKMI